MVRAILLNGASVSKGRLAAMIHFAIWSSMGGNKTSLCEERWGPLISMAKLHMHKVRTRVAMGTPQINGLRSRRENICYELPRRCTEVILGKNI